MQIREEREPFCNPSSLFLLFGDRLVGKLHLTVAVLVYISLIAFFIKSKRFSKNLMTNLYSYFIVNVVKFKGDLK